MAKVFKGKQVFENPDAYIAHLKAMEAERGPFFKEMMKLNDEFAAHLSQALSEQTVLWYTGIAKAFIHFIHWQTDVMEIEDITKGMANSHFRAYWKNKVWDDTITHHDLRMVLREFFTFLKNQKGIANQKVLDSLTGRG